MTGPGRNDRCPCGSGKKFKKCCLTAHEAERDGMVVNFEDDDLDELSNSVLDLIKQGELDEAEARSRELLRRYPDVIDGLDRLARVYEARGDRAKAASYHRQAAHFADTHEDFDPEIAIDHRAAADRLERS